MANLVSQLHDLADSLISSILTAVRAASVAEVIEGDGGGGSPQRSARGVSRAAAAVKASPRSASSGRKPRASAAEVDALKQTAYTAAKMLRKDFSKGDIMKKSGSKSDLGRALTLLVADGKLGKRGDRRKTRYWVK